VLPAIAFSARRAQPRYLPYDSGTDARGLSLRSRRVCRDAGTHSPAFDGARSWNSLDRDASREAAHGPRFVTQARSYDFNVWTTKKRVEKLRYMHGNPVKRGLVAAPEEWRWSSYRFYLLDEAGPVRVNEGWTKISFRDRVA
jgi:hypothetical protein